MGPARNTGARAWRARHQISFLRARASRRRSRNNRRSFRLRRWYLSGATKSFEDLRRTAAAQLVRQPNPSQLGVLFVDHVLAPNHALTLDVGNQTVQHESPLALRRQRANRDLTATLERCEERPLGSHLTPRLLIIQRGENRPHPLVVF